MPMIHASVAYPLNPRWSLEAEVDGIDDGREYYWNNGLWVRYRDTQLWAFAFGSRALWGKVDSWKLYNDLEFFDVAFQIGRSF